MKRSSLLKEYLEELDREESPKNQISRYLFGLTPQLKKMVSQQKPHTLNIEGYRNIKTNKSMD